MGAGKKKNHGKVAQAGKNFLDKMFGNEDSVALTVGTDGIIVNDLPRADDNAAAGIDGLPDGIDGVT